MLHFFSQHTVDFYKVWEPNPLNFRTVRGCCRKREKQSRDKLKEQWGSGGFFRGEPLPATSTFSHITFSLTHILPSLKSVPSLGDKDNYSAVHPTVSSQTAFSPTSHVQRVLAAAQVTVCMTLKLASTADRSGPEWTL